MLIFILQKGHTEVVELLLNNPGIYVNAADKWVKNPLYWAAEVSYNHIEHILCNISFHVNVYITGGTHWGCGVVAEYTWDRCQCKE